MMFGRGELVVILCALGAVLAAIDARHG